MVTRLEQLRELRDRVDEEIQKELAALREHKRGRAKCGTDSGYYRHRRTLGEDACTACKAAHREAENDRVRRRRNSQLEIAS